jgi:hypothetical protein
MRPLLAARRLLVGLLVTGCIGTSARADPPPGAAPATGAIRFYQRYLSSLRLGHCRFEPSCSEYAAQAIGAYGLLEGSARAADRLIRCNAAAARFYPQGRDGRLEDPLEGTVASGGGPRVPRWMLVAGEPLEPPAPATLDPGRRARLDEAVAFALRLEQRGDCERASTEYQRAGSLAGSPETDSWAFARIGACYFAAAQWSAAEGAYLTSGMLASSLASRARAVYRAAVCRFDDGAFAACERLMTDPALSAASADTSLASAARPHQAVPATAAAPDSSPPEPTVPDDRIATLGGLCALARGGWSFASGEFQRAASLSREDEARMRILRLAPFALQGPGLPHRSAGLAGTLSALVPGSGQMYCGRSTDGLRHLLLDAALVWTVISLARDHRGPAAYLTASLTLPFYLGNVVGAGRAAREHDRGQRLNLLRRAIDESAR